MTEGFDNVYEDDDRASSYARLDYPGTYYLAFRDLPRIIGHVTAGARALDFGCGAGRSTRFLRERGFDVVGVDISAAMLDRARREDPDGDYRLVGPGDLKSLAGSQFELILAAFPFDNIPQATKTPLLGQLADLLARDGRLLNLVSSPELYRNEWASFSSRDFPANRQASDGDVVELIMLDVPDRRPVQDVLCSDAAYRRIYAEAGLAVRAVHRPLGTADDPHEWVTEAVIPPWAIYQLVRAD